MAHTTLDHGPLHTHPLLERLAENWWLLALRGAAAVLFGLLALAWPGEALLSLVFLFGIYAFVDGVLSISAAFSRKGTTAPPTWWLVLMGVIGIGAGIAAFSWPVLGAATLVILIAMWAVLTGIVEIVGAIELRKEIDNEWLLILGGVVSVVFGLAMLANPGMGAVAVVWIIAFYALILGGAWIALSLRLKSLAK